SSSSSRHTSSKRDWSSDVCSSDLSEGTRTGQRAHDGDQSTLTLTLMSMFSVIAMTTNRLPMRSAGMPWPALIAMALTTFLVVSGEMMPTAVLPLLASDLEVTTARAGLLVSAWAGTVVLASFPLTRLTARFERPTVIAGALTIFAIATLVTALAPTYAFAMGSRVVAAAATGLLW